MQQVDILEQNIAFGNYQHIMEVTDPSIVGCYFKSILKYMEEPLCKFDRYDIFKCICEEIPKTKPPFNNLIKSI